MGHREDLEAKRPILMRIADDKITRPTNIPIEVYGQEAQDLYEWAMVDKAHLVARRLDWALVEDLPVRAGAFIQAQSLWNAIRFTQEEARREWEKREPYTYEIRNLLVDELGFCFHKRDDLVARVEKIAEGYGHEDCLQDLNDCAVLGEQNRELLEAAAFDMALLDEAKKLSDEMAALLAQTRANTPESQEALELRNRAYTHLEEAVDEVCRVGRHVFRDDEKRLRGYFSAYMRRKNRQYRNQQAREQEATTPEL